ncbi:hypothetical protein MKW92_037615 [Papaver armeniacum]|nr:hypothetical protein MKW92_037615 [Papaver armeniacum]
MADMEVQDRKIVVAIDEGDESIYALTWAIKNVVSQNSNDTVILLYAKPPLKMYSTLDGSGYLFSSDVIMSMEKYSKDVADCVTEKARRVCEHLQNVKVETRIEKGDARDVICLVQIFYVSTHCAQNVKCPVLIVKKPKSEVGNKSS